MGFGRFRDRVYSEYILSYIAPFRAIRRSYLPQQPQTFCSPSSFLEVSRQGLLNITRAHCSPSFGVNIACKRQAFIFGNESRFAFFATFEQYVCTGSPSMKHEKRAISLMDTCDFSFRSFVCVSPLLTVAQRASYCTVMRTTPPLRSRRRPGGGGQVLRVSRLSTRSHRAPLNGVLLPLVFETNRWKDVSVVTRKLVLRYTVM